MATRSNSSPHFPPSKKRQTQEGVSASLSTIRSPLEQLTALLTPPSPVDKNAKQWDANLFDDLVEQLAPEHELEHHVVVAGVLGIELVDLHHVRVIQLAENFHLTEKKKKV